VSLLAFSECALGRSILCFPFLTISGGRPDKRTFAGSVIIIFRPGFFFGFDSVSSEPESIAELADSTE
jgi:hypothetical protein